MTHSIFFLGTGARAEEVRAYMADFAALGLINTFHWVDLADSPTSECVHTYSADENELVQIRRLDEALNSAQGAGLIVAVEDLADSAARLQLGPLSTWVQAIESRIPAGSERVRVFLPTYASDTPPAEPILTWNNIAIAPEDSDIPTGTTAPLRSFSPSEVARISAPTLISLTGLWRGSQGIPLLPGGHVVSTGDTYVRLARSYFRSVDASEVEKSLFAEVSDISSQLPLPRLSDGRQTIYLGDHRQALAGRSAELVGSHRESLITTPTPEKGLESIKQDAFTALKSFLRDFFQATIGNPRNWQAGYGHAIHSKFAEHIQKTLYGDDSVVEVVSGTYQGRMSEKTMARLAAASAIAVQRLRDEGAFVGERHSLQDLWQAYTSYSLTLVDGTDRLGTKLQALQDTNTGNPAIVSAGWQVAGDVSDQFEGYHPVLADILGVTEEDATVLPYDSYKAGLLEEGLQFATAQTSDRNVSRIADDFRNWKNRVSTSFSWQVGSQLSNILAQARENLKHQRARLDELSAELSGYRQRDYGAENRALQRKLRTVGALGWVLALITIYLCVNYYREDWLIGGFTGIDWRWTTLAVFLITVIFTAIQMSIFASARKGIIDEMRNKQLLEENVKIVLENHASALADVDKLARSYQQFLSWSTIIGKSIASPFGTSTLDDEIDVLPTAGLPRSTKIGRAHLDEAARSPLVIELRRNLFEPSWAERALDKVWHESQVAVERSEGIQISSKEMLYGAPGMGSGSELDKIANAAVTADGGREDHLRQKWNAAVTQLGAKRQLDNGLNTVEYYQDGVVQTTNKEQFFGDIERLSQQDSYFSSHSLNAQGISAGANRVDPGVSSFVLTTGEQSYSGSLDTCIISAQFGASTQLSALGSPVQSSATSDSLVFEESKSEAPSSMQPRSSAPSFDLGSTDLF